MVNPLERAEADERPETSAVGHIEVTRRNAEKLPGLFKHLTLEHAQILEQLLELHYAATKGQAPQALLQRTVDAITAHETAEAAVLEPRVSEHHRSRHLMQEHADASSNLIRLGHSLEGLVGTPEYAGTVEQLVAMFQQYSRLEETDLFVIAQTELDASDPNLLQEYEHEKAKAQQSAST